MNIPSDDEIFAAIETLAKDNPPAHQRYFNDPLFRAVVNEIFRRKVMDRQVHA